MSDSLTVIVSAAVGAVVTVTLTMLFPWLLQTYRNRYIDPKTAHKELLLDQAGWYAERADRLTVLRFELGQEPKPDNFKLSRLVSKLDSHDRDWAMKIRDIETLRQSAAGKAAECRNNSEECARLAEEVENSAVIFPI